MTERLVVGGVALVVGLGLGWVGHGLTRYNTATESVTAFQDWRSACPPAATAQQSCEIIQDILDGKTRSEIARVVIAHDNGKPVVGITLPLGVALLPGMGISFGTDPVKVVQYRTCNGQGCIAELPLDDKLQASFDAGKDGKLIFAGMDNKPVSVLLSLKGFADAQRDNRNNEARRGSWFWRMW